MKKYWIIINNEIQRQFTYRASIITYIFGNLLEVVAQIVIWTIIYQSSSVIKGYTYNEMMTYVIIGWFFLASSSNYNFESYIARDIHLGTLSNLIIKPISYLRYVSAVCTGRITIAFFVNIFQALLLFFLFSEHLAQPKQFYVLPLLLAMLIAGYVIKFLIAVLIGLIAFWTTEISGIYYSLNVAVKFLSGAYFPIMLLPDSLAVISQAFPFIYTFYVPMQLYLDKISVWSGLAGLGMELAWIIVLYGLIKLLWRFGLKKFESVGI